MSWRIVQISSNSKLELKLNYLIVRHECDIKKVYIPEIAVLIIESTAVSMTASLLCELTRNKIKIIFCDEKRNPYGELIPYYGAHDSVEKLRIQMNWDRNVAESIWTEIVKEKISKQRDVLYRTNHDAEAELLQTYIDNLQHNDVTNREGHAAKVYFNALFGMDYSRKADNPINAALNYGYSLLLSVVNREITISGYLTMIGIFHDNTFNVSNLASDLMEPFRPLVDEIVVNMNCDKFDKDEKRTVIEILNTVVYVGGKQNYLLNALRIYVNSFFNAMKSGKISELDFYEVEIYESDGVL